MRSFSENKGRQTAQVHGEVGDEAMNMQVEELIPRGAHDNVLHAAVIDLVITRVRSYPVDICVVFGERVAAELVFALLHFCIVQECQVLELRQEGLQEQ